MACCCVEEEFVCDNACNKTITINWSTTGASGTLTYTIAERGDFEDVPNIGRFSSSISCRADGKWFISVVFCTVPGVPGGNIAAILDATSDGCPPVGGVNWTTDNLQAGASATGSIS